MAEVSEREKIDLEDYGIDHKVFFYDEKGIRRMIRKLRTANASFNPYSRYYRALMYERTQQVLAVLREWKDAGYEPDILVLEWTAVVLQVEAFKKIYPKAVVIASEHDVTFQRAYRSWEQADGWLKQRYYKLAYEQLRKKELMALNRCDVVMPHNRKDYLLLLDHGVPDEKLHVLVPYYKSLNLPKSSKRNKQVVFLGDMSRRENYEGAEWFIENVMPELPQIRFCIIGGNPHKSLLRYQSERVEIRGYVTSLADVFADCICMAAPLLMGAGIKIKVLEAMASGVAVLTNEIGIEGISAVSGRDFLFCRNKEEYVKAIQDILNGKINCDEVGKCAKACIQGQFDIEKSVMQYIHLLETIERKDDSSGPARQLEKASFGDWMWDRCFPPKSKQRIMMKLIKRCITHPVSSLKKVLPGNICGTFRTLRQMGLSGIERHLDISSGSVERMELVLEKVADGQPFEHYQMLQFPVCENPAVSIIIPVWNQFQYTYCCLKTILENTMESDYEVIIADDGSDDFTIRLTEIVKHVRVIKTEKNGGFLLNCNHAARYACGTYLVFLNNDTQVQKGWLDSLLKVMQSDASIGLTGSKLVYPDGRLQEAGGIVWRDGSAWNYGNGNSPLEPEYNYVKEADYISGAAIMIRKQLWREIGGFDERFAPAYCEDSDLAFEVRRRGYRVVYQPRSVVVHFEGISNGTDISAGLKHYQVENGKKFYEKWKTELAKTYENGEQVFRARERSRNKKVIVVIDHYVPEYDKDAGSKTTFQYLKMFIRRGYCVKFIADDFYPREPYTTVLQQMGIEVLYGSYYAENIMQWLKQNSENIDVVYMNRPHVAIKYIDFLKRNTHIKIIYYGHDLHFLRLQRDFELTGGVCKKAESEKWKEQELSIMRSSDMNYYPSCVETRMIHQLEPMIPVKAVTAYVFEAFRSDILYDAAKREGILFVGGFNHPPNRDGAEWFVHQIYPEIYEKTKIPFYIVGSNPPQEIRSLHQKGVEIKGFISEEELQRLYDKCRLVVVPLRYGAGVKGKVIEALYHGVPVVTTSVGAEGIARSREIMDIVDGKEEFKEHVLSLYEDCERLRNMSRKAQEYVKRYFCEDAVWDILREDFENVT
ncbi:MAG: glycosyltransferase [Lachnospiraceae bacterium]|nr:glycosyltransferase [Lachnospiraceae bacterium]